VASCCVPLTERLPRTVVATRHAGRMAARVVLVPVVLVPVVLVPAVLAPAIASVTIELIVLTWAMARALPAQKRAMEAVAAARATAAATTIVLMHGRMAGIATV